MHVSCFPDTCVYIFCLRLSALHIYTMRESNISQSMLNPGKKNIQFAERNAESPHDLQESLASVLLSTADGLSLLQVRGLARAVGFFAVSRAEAIHRRARLHCGLGPTRQQRSF